MILAHHTDPVMVSGWVYVGGILGGLAISILIALILIGFIKIFEGF